MKSNKLITRILGWSVFLGSLGVYVGVGIAIFKTIGWGIMAIWFLLPLYCMWLDQVLDINIDINIERRSDKTKSDE